MRRRPGSRGACSLLPTLARVSQPSSSASSLGAATSGVEVTLDASDPFHRTVAAAQAALRDGACRFVLRGPGALECAARLASLVRGIEVALVLPALRGADVARQAREAMVLAGLLGTRVRLSVPAATAGVLREALRERRAARPDASLGYPFGGDAFTALLRVPLRGEVEVEVGEMEVEVDPLAA